MYSESHPEYEDPFAEVDAITLTSITRITVNQKYETITIWVGANPILLDFGRRPNARANSYFATLDLLAEAFERLGLTPGFITCLDRRTPLTAKQSKRVDEEEF